MVSRLFQNLDSKQPYYTQVVLGCKYRIDILTDRFFINSIANRIDTCARAWQELGRRGKV